MKILLVIFAIQFQCKIKWITIKTIKIIPDISCHLVQRCLDIPQKKYSLPLWKPKGKKNRFTIPENPTIKNEIKAKKGDYLPYVGIYAGAEVDKVGEFTRNGAVEQHLDIREHEEFPEPLTNFSAGLSASWELDIWKKLRN